MDEETQRAIEEALHIVQTNTQPSPPPGTTPPPLTLASQDEHPEGPPTDDEHHSQPAQGEQIPTITPAQAEETKARTRRWVGMSALAIGVMSLTMMVLLVVVPLLRPTASVTIIPASTTIQTTTTLTLEARTLATVTLTQTRSVATTGTGHQDAKPARGSITFYNAAPLSQTVSAGTLLTGRDGVQVVTEQTARIPAGNLATNGQATVTAHALQSGPAGNIQAADIYGACCRANVFAANAAFSGGQDARTFPMVTQSDLENVINPLKATILPSAIATFQAQLHPGETNTPPNCTTRTTTDHMRGEEASQINASITAICTASAYQSQDRQTWVIDALHAANLQRFGDGYRMMSDPQIVITQTSSHGTTITLHITAKAPLAYQFSQGQLEAIKSAIAGKDKAQATAWLAHQPGVRAVSIQIDETEMTTLPQQTSAIRCTVLFYAGQEGTASADA